MSKRNLFSVDKSLEKPERVLLVGVMLTADYSGANETRERGFQTALTEAAELVGAAGGDLVSIETSHRDKPHPALFVGTGKAEELAALKLFFQITLLCRREFVVEHNQPDIMLLDRCRQFFRLARTDK